MRSTYYSEPMNEDEITAIHEAAHAVAAIRGGLLFDHVTAEPDDEYDTDGALHWTDLYTSGEVAMPPEIVAVVLLAGPCAEAKLRKLRVDRIFMGQAASDDRAGIAELGLSEQQFVTATRAALDLVEQEWPTIERVADALLEYGELSFEQVAGLIDAE
jgi:hypothetical protein